ncbi:MAG: hypothetical protein ACR2GD_07210 [Pyrinomonadaceae bacterium]
MNQKEHSGLIFGVHPFGKAGMPEGVATGAPDDFDKIGRAIMKSKGELNHSALIVQSGLVKSVI